MRENHDPFKLIATGGSTDHAVQWSLTNGEGIVTINESTGEITLTNKAFGDVTVTATKPGNDAYSEHDSQLHILCQTAGIAEVTFSELHRGQ